MQTGPRRSRRDVVAERNTAYPDTAHPVADHAGQVQRAGGLLFLAALWLVVSPWILAYDPATAVAYAHMATGALLGAMALLWLTIPRALPRLAWVAFGLGAWTICAPFLLSYPPGFDRVSALWNGIATGAAVIALAAWHVVATDNAEHRTTRAARRR